MKDEGGGMKDEVGSHSTLMSHKFLPDLTIMFSIRQMFSVLGRSAASSFILHPSPLMFPPSSFLS